MASPARQSQATMVPLALFHAPGCRAVTGIEQVINASRQLLFKLCVEAKHRRQDESIGTLKQFG
jgi:hypothetical protein